jgi:DNA replication protein DnaC
MASYFDGNESLYIHGPVGSGKTWLAAAIAREEMKTSKRHASPGGAFPGRFLGYGNDVLFISTFELLARLRNSFGPDRRESEQRIFDRFTQVPVLCLDDVGAEKSTEYTRSSLTDIIGRRGIMPYGRTVITSNCQVNELERVHGQRFVDRIVGMCKMVRLNTGRSRRREQQ